MTIKYIKKHKEGVYEYKFRIFSKNFLYACKLGRAETNQSYSERADNMFFKELSLWLKSDKNILKWEQEKDLLNT